MMAGVSPVDFWQLTPYQTNLVLEAFGDKRIMAHNDSAWMMWHNALLSRIQSEKFPPLKDFIRHDKPVNEEQNNMPIVDKNAIIARMKAHNQQIEKENNGSNC